MSIPNNKNVHEKTVDSFGDEWSTYTQAHLANEELGRMFSAYFSIFPWQDLPDDAEGFDMGCGSGRWARFVAQRVGKLHCIDASGCALEVAKSNLQGYSNVTFHHSTTDTITIPAYTCDFGYSLGVLHHIPDTHAALVDCVRLLKPGAPFLVYLYYRFDNRPAWFRGLWWCSNLMRKMIQGLPVGIKSRVTDAIAVIAYWPLSRLALLIKTVGGNPAQLPLSHYRRSSFQTLRTDSRDRFGTPLEQRFTRSEITEMMQTAGLENIQFSDNEPYWCAVGTKA